MDFYFLVWFICSGSYSTKNQLKHTPGSLLPIHCSLLMHSERDSNMHTLCGYYFLPFLPYTDLHLSILPGIGAIVAI